MGKRRRQNRVDTQIRRKRGVVVQEQGMANFCIAAIASQYENVFSQVRPLINEMKTIFPYGVGGNGAKLPVSRTPELVVLKDPNDDMGWADFADLAFATWLTEDELNIRVHFNGRRVIGYTVLPPSDTAPIYDGEGRRLFTVQRRGGAYETITSDEVMTLRYSRLPRDLDRGVSPATSVKVWAQIDDFIAQYQRAYFENGAKPATIMIIKASTEEKFKNKQRELEEQLRGASNRNKTLYLWHQFLSDGSGADQVEVKTIQGSNAELAIKELSEIVSDRLNKAYGVSNFLLGDDSSAKYDNAELSDQVFTKRRVYPSLQMFWSEFQHELDRIFFAQGIGGLGYAIQFTLEIPELTDRLKTRAETEQIQAEIRREDKKANAEVATATVQSLITLIGAGAGSDDAIRALGLNPEKWGGVAENIFERQENVTSAQALANLPTVRAAEATSNPSNPTGLDEKPNKILSIPEKSSHDVQKSATCGCDRCKRHTTDIKFKENYEPEFDLPDEQNIKDVYDILINLAEQEMSGQPAADLEAVKQAINQKLYEASQYGALGGAKFLQTLALGRDIEAALKKVAETSYTPSDAAIKAQEARTNELVKSFSDEAREAYLEIKAKSEGYTQAELKKALSDAVPRNRAEAIARTETHSAINAGRLDLDQYISETYGVKFELVWDAHLDSASCEYCAAMDGSVTPLGEAFPATVIKDGITYTFEHTVWNDHGRIPQAHTKCRCTFNERVVRMA